MSRTIPIALQAHLDTGATTMCGILRIEPVRPGYSVIGLTDLDRNVVYDDGNGEVTYLAPVGFTASAYVATADFAVDNAETKSLFPEFDIPQLTEADISAGAYDYARYKLMLLNYEDLTQGHTLLMTGTLGEMRTVDGLSFLGELRSLFQQYRQSIVERDSLTCRATFGSQSADSSNAATAPKIERFPCGFVVDSLWIDGSVTAVGVEDTLAFSDSFLIADQGAFSPGVVEWLTGSNAGRSFEVDFYTVASNSVTLAFPTAFPIQVGDEYRIRPDCTKQWSGQNSCLSYNNRLNYRGEPFIPVGDAGSTAQPGAGSTSGVTGGSQGDTTSPYDPPSATVALPLVNGDFESALSGWAVTTLGTNHTITTATIADPTTGAGPTVLVWENTGSDVETFSTIQNDAVGLNANAESFLGRMRIRCTEMDSGGEAYIAVRIPTFSDPAGTIPVGGGSAYWFRPTEAFSGFVQVVGRSNPQALYMRFTIEFRCTKPCKFEVDLCSWDLEVPA